MVNPEAMNTTSGSATSRSRRVGAAQRAQVLAAFDRSGLSAAAFAREHGIHYTTFCGWRARREKSKGSPAFVQVELPAAAVPAGKSSQTLEKVELVIELGVDARMRVDCEAQLALAARLLQKLSAAC